MSPGTPDPTVAVEPLDPTTPEEAAVRRPTDAVSLFFAVVFLGLGALGLAIGVLDLGELDGRLGPAGLVVLGVAGLAATLVSARRSTRSEADGPTAGWGGPATPH